MTETTEGQATEAQQGEAGGSEQGQQQEQSFSQADVDRIVRERVKRERDKYADYDDLKTKAGEKATLEQRVAQIEAQAKENEVRALRAEIANAKGLTPTQAKRLVGNTRDELEADADELLTDLGERKKQGNHVPSEGNNTSADGSDTSSFAKKLFSTATDGG